MLAYYQFCFEDELYILNNLNASTFTYHLSKMWAKFMT